MKNYTDELMMFNEDQLYLFIAMIFDSMNEDQYEIIFIGVNDANTRFKIDHVFNQIKHHEKKNHN